MLSPDKIEKCLRYNKILAEIEHVQKNLKPPVDVEERAGRVRILLEIRDNCRSLLKEIPKTESAIKEIGEIIERADHLKRENCLLKISDSEPFGVLAPDELCTFKEKSRNNLIEIRRYYGLHKTTYYDDGLCVSMALTKPKLVQNYHSHSRMDEYTMVLSGSILIKARIGEELETLKADEGDIIYSKKDTIHTLFNKTKKTSLNATVKIPMGFKDRKHIDAIPKKGRGEIKVLKLKPTPKPWGILKSQAVRLNGYGYRVDYMSLNPLADITLLKADETTIYIIEGEIHLQTAGLPTASGRDALVFITKERETIIKNTSEETTAKLYVVSETTDSH